MAHSDTISLGDLIVLFYEEFMAMYEDEDLASVAAAASINELLSRQSAARDFAEAAA